jgi:hypothetical protein
MFDRAVVCACRRKPTPVQGQPASGAVWKRIGEADEVAHAVLFLTG